MFLVERLVSREVLHWKLSVLIFLRFFFSERLKPMHNTRDFAAWMHADVC